MERKGMRQRLSNRDIYLYEKNIKYEKKFYTFLRDINVFSLFKRVYTMKKVKE